MDTKFHPQLIEDAAAWLFWTLVERDGFSHTLDDVLTTQGQSLLLNPDKEKIFSRYKLDQIKSSELVSLYDAIAKHAWERSINEENLIGMVFKEDRLAGRSPSAINIGTGHWNIPITVKGDILPAYGKLCIRHPLPAVVFTKELPSEKIFRIADTQALGFDTPIWFNYQYSYQVDDELWLLSGIFHIPENIALAQHPWTEIIPNCICTSKGITFQANKNLINIEFNWNDPEDKTRSVAEDLTSKLKKCLPTWLYRK